MTLITTVGLVLGSADRGTRNLHPMAANRLQQRIGSVWHVAVVTLAARGIGCMVRMFRNLFFEFLMALQARLVAIHAC